VKPPPVPAPKVATLLYTLWTVKSPDGPVRDNDQRPFVTPATGVEIEPPGGV
jgi:hypothetical protein